MRVLHGNIVRISVAYTAEIYGWDKKKMDRRRGARIYNPNVGKDSTFYNVRRVMSLLIMQKQVDVQWIPGTLKVVDNRQYFITSILVAAI